MSKHGDVTARPTRKNKHMIAAWGVILLGSIALFLLIAVSIAMGVADISISTVWEAFFSFDAANTQHLIVVDLRLPRLLASALVGAAFGVAGAIMQGITKNPMADSGLLGINSGATFALSICMAFFPGLGYLKRMLLAFAGAAFGAGMVGGVSSMRRGGATPMRLILAGATVSALLTALSQGIALYFDVSQDLMFWSAGSVSSANWAQIKIIAPWVLGGIFAAILLSRSISILSLGEDVAKGLGLNTILVNLACLLIVLVLAGAAVSVVGAVGFVGLIVPHMSQFFVGMDYRWIIPTSAVLGALLVVAADLGARTINPPFETPLGVMIALAGVPLFLYLARKQKDE